jgi:hypothetical protein
VGWFGSVARLWRSCAEYTDCLDDDVVGARGVIAMTRWSGDKMGVDSSQYRVHFLNQYAKIPENILEKLNSLYPTRYESVRHCLGLIIVNLLEFDEVAYSRNKNFYSANHTKNYTYANMLNALEIAIEAGYAAELKTSYQSFDRGYSSTLKAGPRLSEFNLPEGIELDLESLPLLSIDKRPIFENDDLDVVKAHSANTSLEFINHLDRMYDEALKLNRDYWNKIIIDTRLINAKLKCFNRVGLTRIFKKGEVGRWHQKGEMSFQQLPKEERPKLLLNSEKVAEIDYSAMHPHILYAWENKRCPDYFYETIMNQCGCDRFVAKKITLIAINAGSYKSLVGAINLDKAKTERANRNRATPEPVLYSELKKQNLTPEEVVEAIKIAHPAIAKYIYSALANKLMLVESDIMTSVLLKLMSLGIPALPVHDSVIVPSRYKDVARLEMQNNYREYTGFSIAIK